MLVEFPRRDGDATIAGRDAKLKLAIRLDEKSLMHFEAGSPADAERYCRAALALLEELDGLVHADRANLLQRLSAILIAQCRYVEAEACAAQAVSVMDRIAADPRLEAALKGTEGELIRIEALRQWGSALRQLGQYSKAEPALRRAAMLAERHARPAPLVGVLNELGMVSKYTAQFAKGVRIYRRALALAVGLYGEIHPTVATIYHNIGGLEHARGRFRTGEQPARRAWEIRRQLLGPDHPDTVADECAWAGLLDGLGRFAESRPIYERALTIFERHYGPEHFEIAATLHNLSGIDAAEGDLKTAEQRAARALEIKEKLFGRNHPEWAQTARQLAAILHLQEAAQAARA